MSDHGSADGRRPRQEEATISVSPISHTGNDHGGPRRVSAVDASFNGTESYDISTSRRQELEETNAEVLTYSFGDDSVLSDSLGIIGQQNSRLRRAPVPLKSTRRRQNTIELSSMPSPGDTLVGTPSPSRLSKPGGFWGFGRKLFSTHDSESEGLTTNLSPRPGTEYTGHDLETAADATQKGTRSTSLDACDSRRNIESKRWHWLVKVVVILSLYSTVMSGIWLVAAIVQPRWGRQISSKTGLAPSMATLLAAGLAKTIELSFVTVFITFLGQALTRRALARGSRGITLAEMSMRNWVIQPGSLLTHFDMLRHASLTALGVLSLLAALVAAFYTTASDAMVSPKLMYGNWEHKVLSGYVRSSYSNVAYVKLACPSMFRHVVNDDNDNACSDVILSGESYRNLRNFMQVWTDINSNGSSNWIDLAQRPAATASLHGNTTLIASWIESEYGNVTAQFAKTGRIINNVTMAMPYPGVARAAMSSLNGILQPDDLSGLGEYAVRAGVVSPTVNVLCVNMGPDELEPVVYTEWPHAHYTHVGSDGHKIALANWTQGVPEAYSSSGELQYLNETVVDDIFKWGAKYKRRSPVFPMLPSNYNTVADTMDKVREADAVYIMGKSPQLLNYTLCEVRSWVSPNCSTRLNISGVSGSKMAAHCEDFNDKDSYWRSFPAHQDWSPPVPDWRWLGKEWILSSDFNGGLQNSNASNARILTQLALVNPRLPPDLPSMAEGLAVFASSTLILGSIDTPFVHFWNYTQPGNMIGEPGAVNQFNASVMTQEYTCGHVSSWQGIFYIILGAMFGLNLFCFVCTMLHTRLVTDYTEAHNLFALALNSSQDEQLRGSCGGGPEGRDLALPWQVEYASNTNHCFIRQGNDRRRRRYGAKPGSDAGELKHRRSAMGSYNRLSSGSGLL